MRMPSLWGRHVATAEHDPVEVVQKAMTNPGDQGLGSLFEAFDAILLEQLWRRGSDGQGQPFENFGAFATAAQPFGLGIRTPEAADLARHILLKADHYAAWTEILERIARKPGRPKKSANGDDFRFFKVSKAAHAKDRLLLVLKKEYPDHFQAVCDCVYTPYRAAVEAGELRGGHKSMDGKVRMRFGVCDLEAVKSLRPQAQQKLLREVFSAMRLDAQCVFIASELEPTLGSGLAQRWQSQPQARSGS